MTDLGDIRRLVGEDHGLASVATLRDDGSPQVSVVNAGLLTHPVTGGDVVGFVARGDARKIDNLRARPRLAITWRGGWQWATVEGDAEVIGPDDPAEGIDDDGRRLLLRAVFQAAGGTHEDFDTYDEVMREERRVAVLVTPHRIYGVTPG